MNKPDRRSTSEWFWQTLKPYLWAIAIGAIAINLVLLAIALQD